MARSCTIFPYILIICISAGAQTDAIRKIDLLCDSLVSKVYAPPTKNRLAVLPFTNKTGQADQGQGTAVAERLIANLQARQLFVMVDREQFQKAMAEIALSQSGAISDSTVLQAGRFMAADYLLSGTIAEAFGNHVISARIMQTETGQIIASASQVVAPVALAGLHQELLGEKATVGASLFRSMVVPGWGQFYADKPVRGIISLVAFLGAAGYLGWRGFATYTAHKDYDDAYNNWIVLRRNNDALLGKEVAQRLTAAGYDPATVSPQIYDQYYEAVWSTHAGTVNGLGTKYSDAYDQAVIAGAILGGVWALNLIDALIAGAQSRSTFKPYFSSRGLHGCTVGFCYTF